MSESESESESDNGNKPQDSKLLLDPFLGWISVPGLGSESESVNINNP